MMTERQSASQAGLTQNQVLEIGSNSSLFPKLGWSHSHRAWHSCSGREAGGLIHTGHGTVAVGGRRVVSFNVRGLDGINFYIPIYLACNCPSS